MDYFRCSQTIHTSHMKITQHHFLNLWHSQFCRIMMQKVRYICCIHFCSHLVYKRNLSPKVYIVCPICKKILQKSMKLCIRLWCQLLYFIFANYVDFCKISLFEVGVVCTNLHDTCMLNVLSIWSSATKYMKYSYLSLSNFYAHMSYTYRNRPLYWDFYFLLGTWDVKVP